MWTQFGPQTMGDSAESSRRGEDVFRSVVDADSFLQSAFRYCDVSERAVAWARVSECRATGESRRSPRDAHRRVELVSVESLPAECVNMVQLLWY